MVQMLWCCITKEATPAVSIVKSTFQVFSIYALGNTVAKDYIIAVITITFTWDLLVDNEIAAWLIICYFLSMHTVLTFIRGVIVYSGFWLSWSICKNSLTKSSSLPLLHAFIASCSRLTSLLVYFFAKFLIISIKSNIFAWLPFSSSFSKSRVLQNYPTSW